MSISEEKAGVIKLNQCSKRHLGVGRRLLAGDALRILGIFRALILINCIYIPGKSFNTTY